MTGHYLDSLLKPKSIALVGASNREGSPGRILADLVINSSFQGNVYPINPGYESLLETTCYPDFDSLPETVDHAVLAVANERLEQTLKNGIQHGIRAATIFSSCVLENESPPLLKQRITKLAKDAGIAVCGGNGMGFYSITHGLYAGMYPMPKGILSGGISFIAQSGSAFTALAHNGCRLKFNLCVSSGNEMVTTVSDYMDWSLAQESTRVIALFLETVREPIGFINALEKAQQQNIPVVILKVGKSELSAEMAQTHTGAIAGNHAAYQAVFDRYNVIQVNDFGELTATLMMFQTPRRLQGQAGARELATIQESGGLMELVTDIADDLGIQYASISEQTKSKLKENLDPGLKADNPLDAWGSNDDFENKFHRCFSALMQDPNVGIGMFFANFRDGYYLSEAFCRMVIKVSKETNKPLALVNCHTDISNENLSKKTCEAGVPLIDGTREALLAVKHLIKFRDNQNINDHDTQQIDALKIDMKQSTIEKWQDCLKKNSGNALSEQQSINLFSDFGITTPKSIYVESQHQIKPADFPLEFPVVLKTAVTDITHKSDHGGVIVNIKNHQELLDAYTCLCKQIGPEVLIAEMVSPGTEIGLGMINDPQFGPFVMAAAGGVLIELLSDSSLALAPITPDKASKMLSTLKINKMLDGLRGMPPGNRASLIDAIVRLSIIADTFKDHISEIDINPIIVNETGAYAVDGLVIIKN